MEMSSLLLLFVLLILLAYHRVRLLISTCCIGLFLLGVTKVNGVPAGIIISWICFLILLVPLNMRSWRRKYFSQRVLDFFRRVMPSMSRTEREAIAAGTVTWEGDLFRGNPNWKKLLGLKSAKLTQEEQAFIDGPVETLCGMLNDWNIRHDLADLPPDVWRYIKEQGFFGLIIPKQYGGKGFSAYAHAQIIVKVSSISITASSTISVPNSLGPAELLLHYGTEEQKQYYLPRLARGEEVPCFALTSPDAGSDAGAMHDHGVVCWGEYQGQKTLGIKLQFNKRYITLAPVATVIGLAFKLYDPDHLLGAKDEIGITCALIPRDTAGISIGRRHYPIDTPFQNGPIVGQDVFIPVEWIIGGAAQAGNGWRMLMECLAAGRAITLPASALGGAKAMVYATGAYARIRKQFNLPIARFEGIEDPLARIGAFTYLMDAARTLAVSSIDAGEKPAVASAIVKYHVTEMGRRLTLDAMDIHGGKAICLGPKNYIARGYQSAPIAITVEGANILTRSMIIYGQGAMRCHPYVFAEIEAAKLQDPQQALVEFDKTLMQHIGFVMSNFVRSFVLAVTSSILVMTPSSKMKRYYQHATRFASVLAMLSDISMLVFGGSLKRKESVSGRLGDILSYLYMLSAVLKQYHEQGELSDDLPIVKYAADHCLYEIQERIMEIIRNYPLRPVAWILKIIVFPFGKHFARPNDKLIHKIAKLLSMPTDSRLRLSAGAFISTVHEHGMADLQDALLKTLAAEPIEKILRAAKHDHLIDGYSLVEQAQSALQNKIISVEQFDVLMQADSARQKVIAVDDFATADLARTTVKESVSVYTENNSNF